MHIKKPLSILLTICMIVGLLPWSVMPARADATPVTEIEVADWAALKGNSNAATVTTGEDGVTTITLNACIKATGKLEIGSDAANEHPYVLDLNGYGIRYAGEDGSVIAPSWRCTGLTLKDSTPGRATYYITLGDRRGTAVSEQKPNGTEGTDYIAVTGGYITGGSAPYGGGIYDNSNTSFTMEGGTICGNKARSYGGVYAKMFTMSGGTISYNYATSNTGGVHIGTSSGTALMTGGTIEHNSGASCSDVENDGTFVMTGGAIGYNGQTGNSVYNNSYNGHFYRKSGSIYGTVDGTAVKAIHTVTASASSNGSVAVSSAPAYTEGTTSYYAAGDTVTLTVAPATGYAVDSVSYNDGSDHSITPVDGVYSFTMPNANVTVSATFTQPAAQVGTTKYPTLQEAIDKANSALVTLLRDVTLDAALTVPAGKTVTLDLAGHTIDRGLAGQSATDSGSVIEVYGSLTLTDNSEDKTGTITGGNVNNFGGGVYVSEGTFTMQGGTITGNQGGAGGVYVAGGPFAGDPSKRGTFNMTGGTITGNNAPGFGGGVCVSKDCTFNVSGSPVISGNWTAGKWDAGSARYVRDEENNNSEADDVHLSATNTFRTYITVTGALESGASIYVNRNAEAGRAFAQAGAGYTIGETDAACFHSDVGDSLAAMLEGNEVMFKKSLTEGMIGAIAAQTYSGTEKEPTVTVTDGETTLTKGTDYTVSYRNNVNAAESTASRAPTVTVTGKGGYTGTASKTFTINKKPVTVSGLTAEDKVYDGTTAATLDCLSATITGRVDGDDVTVASATGTFDNKNVGTDIPVAISNITLGGADVGNYVLAPTVNQENMTGNISKKTLTITGVRVANKEYDGDTDATAITTGATISGVISGEEANVGVSVTGAFDSADKGNDKTVTLSGWTLAGTASSNYEVDEEHSQKTATASITGIQVYISGLTASDKTYDGTDAATVTGTAVLKKARNNDVVAGLTVSDITAKFADKNASENKTVTITGGTLSDTTNYTLVPSATTGLTANITAKPVTITGLSAENKVYDGNTTATVTGTAVISGLVSGDTVTVTAGSAAFADENAGDGKAVTFSGYALDGADKGNYALSAQPASVTANITKANATCTAPVAKTGLIYDGSARALVTAGSATGGEMQYSLDGNTYGTGIPEGTDAKSYTVYYKVVGDKNHNDVAPASIAVSIAKEDQLAPSLTSPVTIAAPATTAEITGVTTAMEYSTDNKTWTACADPFSVGKGVYYIRLKADANHNAGSAATVIVKGADEYALTVTGGTGSGGYEAGASVSVSATVPAGEKFVNWTPTNVTLTDEQKASATVTFTMPGSDVTLSANFTDKPLESVSLPASLSLKVGATQTLTPTFAPSDCKYKAVTWSSADTSVVTVDENGKLTAVAVGGPVNITATSTASGSKTAVCAVTVTSASSGGGSSSSSDSSSSDSSSGGGSSSTTPSTTTTNADGSKTETSSTTKTTTNTDGSRTATTTEKSTTTAADGAKTESTGTTATTTKTNNDGTTTAKTEATETATTTAKDGTRTTTETKSESTETLDKSGNGTVEGKTTETVKDASGKVTATTVTESKGTVETAANGTKTTTTKNTAVTTDAATGKQTTAVTTEKTVEAANGSTGTVKTDEQGNTVAAEAALSEKAVAEAASKGETVTLPVEVKATTSKESAAPVAITLPENVKSATVEVPVENLTPGTVAVIVNADGSEKIVKTSTTGENGVVLTLDSSATVKIVDNSKNFTDVQGDEWFANNVAWTSSHEIMNGMGDGSFAPDADTTQGMMEQILFNIDGNEIAQPGEGEAWWNAADNWAASGVTAGLGDAHDPTAPATREVDIVMMYNYAKAKGYDVSARADLSKFSDAGNVSEGAHDAMAWAVAMGIIEGSTDENGNTVLDAQGIATRAQVGTMAERFCEKVMR